jgi:hypothetical protein
VDAVPRFAVSAAGELEVQGKLDARAGPPVTYGKLLARWKALLRG